MAECKSKDQKQRTESRENWGKIEVAIYPTLKVLQSDNASKLFPLKLQLVVISQPARYQ